jgi:hypothetical protein
MTRRERRRLRLFLAQGISGTSQTLDLRPFAAVLALAALAALLVLL